MIYDSGTVKVYSISNTATAGSMPTETFTLYCISAYGERTVGYNRFYTAKQYDEQVDLLIRLPRDYGVKTNMKCVLKPYTHTDGSVYQIQQVQYVSDDNGLPAMDLTLGRLEGVNADEIEDGTC